jgi:4-hydroxy-3-methylbut-2-enyl diphosphate reductase
LTVIDATCPDVIRTHELVRAHCEDHGDVLYIGKQGHPEAEGTVSLSDRVHLITSCADIEKLNHLNNVLITNQTTLSLLDCRQIIDACLKKYPQAETASEICQATRIRQEAVMHLKDIDLLIVVGDARSNNSHQLKEIGLKSGIPEAVLIDSVHDLTEDMIKEKDRIAVTSGSSTPNELTKQVIDYLQEYARDPHWKLPPTAEVTI